MQNFGVDPRKVPFEAINPAMNQPANITAMQGVPQVTAESVKKEMNDTYLGGRAAQMAEINPATQIAVAAPIWYLLAQSMDKFAAKTRGEYSTTNLAKIGQFGENVTNKFKGGTVGKSSFAKWINDSFRKTNIFIKKNIVQKSAVLRAISETPTQPEMAMVKGQANGLKGFLLFDYDNIIKDYQKPLKNIDDLAKYGVEPRQIKRYKSIIAKNPTKAKAIFERAQYTYFSPKAGKAKIGKFMSMSQKGKDFVLRQLNAKKLGYESSGHFNKVLADSQSYADDVIKACEKASRNGVVFKRAPGGKLFSKLLGRVVDPSEFANKLKAATGATPFKTKLGKMLPKWTGIGLEGLTNRFAGGKLVAIMQAWLIAEAVVRTARAGKDEKGVNKVKEKVKTFTERIIELAGFFITMPIAVRVMHKFGGMKYAGMKGQDVAKYRTELKAFNDKVLAKGFANKAEYAAAKGSLKQMLSAGVKNPLTKLAKRIGRFINVGNEAVRPFSKLGMPKFKFNNALGFPVRIALAMFMLMPFFNKLVVKCSHAIFGRPKVSVLDKEEEQKPTETPPTEQVPPTAVSQSPSNLINQYVNKSQQTPAPQPMPQATEATTKVLEEVKPQVIEKTMRTYVPSSVGISVAPPDESAALAALKRSESTEKRTLEALAMK